MSQFDYGVIDPNAKSGPQLALDLNDFRDALNTLHRGSVRPTYAQPGMLWVKETSSTQWDLMWFNGYTDFVLRSVNPTTNTLINIPSAQIQGLDTALATCLQKDAATTTGAAIIPSGSYAQRPASPQAGMLRLNSDLLELERYQGGKWLSLNVLDKAMNEAPPVTLASASTVAIGAAEANTINISGTTTITSFDSIAAGAVRRLVFQGALTLTNNASSLILPGAANITTAVGDVAEFVSLGSGKWKCLNYLRASFDATGRQHCTAWVNFSGVGTPTIRDGFNVSSITRIGTGNYAVNFGAAMTRADYAVSHGFDSDQDGVNVFAAAAAPRSLYLQESLKATSGFRALTGSNVASGGALIDFRAINLQVFGGK